MHLKNLLGYIARVGYIPRFPAPGETLHAHGFSIGFGGKGANQCIMASRLGAKTAMVAKVGKDLFGSNYLDNFKENGVDIDHVSQTDKASTGTAPIAVDDNGQNAIIIVSGANMLLSTEDVEKAEDMIKNAKVIICQLEISAQTTLSTLRLARKYGVCTILNPAPGQSNIPQEMYQLADYFCPNETETEILTGLPVKTIEDAYKAADVLHSRGCDTVVITMGEAGAVFSSKNNQDKGHVPAKKVKPVDTTGAGDAFIGSFAFYITCFAHLTFEEKIKRAGEIASISVMSPGTQTSYPLKDQLPKDLFL